MPQAICSRSDCWSSFLHVDHAEKGVLGAFFLPFVVKSITSGLHNLRYEISAHLCTAFSRNNAYGESPMLLSGNLRSK